ncbi:DUF92 domain-containing protein [Marinicrinis lubricantis]|uniref:DUF92 domain-containing protein n=1 Tax=Marinicrinis lubricantis TaxID=2086470 RepID=A0ABW1IT67_9BACL
MGVHWIDWILGILLNGAAAGAAYEKRMLTASGAAAATVVGGVIFALGDASWYVTLLAFFISSSLLSKWKKRKKAALEQEYEKGSTRDSGQVLANGGAAAAACIGFALTSSPVWAAAFLGAMASVNGDTWATEVGALSRTQPRHILSGKRLTAGTSGGITPLGTFASLLGSLFMGFCFAAIASMIGDSPIHPLWAMILAGAGGMAGSLFDSLLGATLQRMYTCRVCGNTIEKAVHCGESAQPSRGWNWMNNDAVNFISSCVGAAIAVLIFWISR